MDIVHDRMELYDACEPELQELIQEFGLARALAVGRQCYGRWDEAWDLLEAERQALQVQRWERKT